MTESSPPPAFPPIPPLGLASAPERSRENPHNWQGIAAAILGLLGSPLFGIMFGIFGLRSVKAGTANNRGLALTGIIAGASWFVISVVAGVGFFVLQKVAPSGTTLTDPGDVKVGECFAEGPEEPESGLTADVMGLRIIDCATAHHGEVYYLGQMSEAAYPGFEESAAYAEKVCLGSIAVSKLDLDKAGDLTPYYLFPTQGTWGQGDRDIRCTVVSDAEDLIGSVLATP